MTLTLTRLLPVPITANDYIKLPLRINVAPAAASAARQSSLIFMPSNIQFKSLLAALTIQQNTAINYLFPYDHNLFAIHNLVQKISKLQLLSMTIWMQ